MDSRIQRAARSVNLWLPATLLVAVSLNQLRLAHTEALSPWSGGGFGMFSSTDSPDNRHLHVFVQNEGVRREVKIPPDLEEAARRATTLPTYGRLRELATILAEIESDGVFVWDEVNLRVWAVDYDSSTLLPRGRLLRKERFDLAGE